MSLRIQNNIEAFNAHRQLNSTAGMAAKSMERLASGFRINRAADDAAGLAISEKLRGQIGGLGQAQRNAGDAVSLVQTAEGALAEVHSMLGRVRELAVQYKNGTLSASDKTSIENEVTAARPEISRIGSDTKFNGITLLSGTPTVTFQVGADDGQTITVDGCRPLRRRLELLGRLGDLHRLLDGRRSPTIDTAIQSVATVARDLRCGAEPARAHPQQPGRLRGEPHGVREPDPGRGHGIGDDQVHEVPDPAAGGHVDARSGERRSAGRAEPAPLEPEDPDIRDDVQRAAPGRPAVLPGRRAAPPGVPSRRPPRTATGAACVVRLKFAAARPSTGVCPSRTSSRASRRSRRSPGGSPTRRSREATAGAFVSLLDQTRSQPGGPRRARSAPSRTRCPGCPAARRCRSRPAYALAALLPYGSSPAGAAGARGRDGRDRRAGGAARLERRRAHRAVPHGHGRRGERAGPLVRLLRLVGRGAGRRAARRLRPGLRRPSRRSRTGPRARAASSRPASRRGRAT